MNEKIKGSFLPKVEKPIAYFCAEYGLKDDESLYAGGLGVLAADMLFEAADQEEPLVAIGFKYAGVKTAEHGFEILKNETGIPLTIEVPIEKRNIVLQAWVKRFSDKVFLFLLDPDLKDNADADRKAGNLYDSNFHARLKQQIYIGIGGFRLLKLLNIEPRIYHLNEGNMAFAGLALLAEKFPSLKKDLKQLIAAVRGCTVGTKHTILSVGSRVSEDTLWQLLGIYCETHAISKEFLMSLGRDEEEPLVFRTTKFLLNLSGKANAVSALHAKFEKEKYPDSKLIPITNGVYKKRWQRENWREAGEIDSLSDEKIWTIKNKLKNELIEEVKRLSGITFQSQICTMVWARRFVPYKRSLDIWSDMERLRAILLNPKKPMQLIISGKVYGADPESQSIMEKVRLFASNHAFEEKIAFVPGYSLDLASKCIAGADVWLNTPKRGVEACGTSGMKAALNGALMASVSDGWIDEVDLDNIGWILSDNDLSASLYEKIEKEILPEFYNQENNVPKSWIERMRKTIHIAETSFGTERMLGEYIEKLYK